MKVVEVKILYREDKESASRNDLFGVKIFDPKFVNERKNAAENVEKPRLGKRDECMIEIVNDEINLQNKSEIEMLIDSFKNLRVISW